MPGGSVVSPSVVLRTDLPDMGAAPCVLGRGVSPFGHALNAPQFPDFS